MDKEFIKELLFTEDGKNEKLVKDGDFIDSELLELMRKSKKKNLQKIFYINDTMPSGGYKYIVELECPVCKKMFEKQLSKTKLMQVLGHAPKYQIDKYICHCDICEANAKEQEKEDRKIQNDYHKQKEQEEIEFYIENVLNPFRSFSNCVSANEKISTVMRGFYGYDFDAIVKRTILAMDYRDFLNTPYWDGVRNYKLKKSKYRCQLCGNKGVLNVHHKTYENHGREHIKSVADSDLIVLCKDCHKKFHDKLNNKVV